MCGLYDLNFVLAVYGLPGIHSSQSGSHGLTTRIREAYINYVGSEAKLQVSGDMILSVLTNGFVHCSGIHLQKYKQVNPTILLTLYTPQMLKQSITLPVQLTL